MKEAFEKTIQQIKSGCEIRIPAHNLVVKNQLPDSLKRDYLERLIFLYDFLNSDEKYKFVAVDNIVNNFFISGRCYSVVNSYKGYFQLCVPYIKNIVEHNAIGRLVILDEIALKETILKDIDRSLRVLKNIVSD